MSHKQLKEIKDENKEFNARELQSTLKPEHLPACYNVILIEPYEKEPDVALRYWRQDSKGKWGFFETCNWTPPKLSMPQKDAAQQ